MWPDAQSTQELLSAAKAGQEDAINRLLDRHRTALRRMVDLRMDRAMERRVDASDVVQDVLLEANRRLNDYLRDPVMPFHLWLRQLAKDRIIDLHRRHRVAAKRSLDRERPLEAAPRLDQSTLDLAAQLCDREMTPAEAATWRELERRFQSAIEQLDERELMTRLAKRLGYRVLEDHERLPWHVPGGERRHHVFLVRALALRKGRQPTA